MTAFVIVVAAVCTASLAASASNPARSWTTVPSPSPDHVITGLNGVSCLSATSCIAAGFNWFSGAKQTLIESWDGSDWTVIPSPNDGTSDNQFDSVSCSGPTSCTAVGSWESGPSGDQVSQTLIETWDGTDWTIANSPDDGALSNWLTSISCPAASDCVAVGGYDTESADGEIDQPLIETWDGGDWTVASGVTNTTDHELLNAVSCSSTTICMAVGADNGNALAETGDGTSWSLAAVSAFDSAPSLSAVSCVGATGVCVAVGYQSTVWTEMWNGSSWSNEIRIPTHKNAELGGISCVSTTSCVVVGSYETNTKNQNPPTRTLIALMGGKKWTKSKSPNPGRQQNWLRAVSCTTNCVAVGSDDTAGADTTLVLMNGG